MRRFLLIIMIIYFIGFIFFKSNTIVTKQWKEDIAGIEYLRTSYSLNWNNFFNYFRDLYKNILPQSIKGKFK
ncbi:MAG: hypothetical protein Q8O13_05155 [Candidatus Omnitrophota bacterium]|nr:hypothetical protein [Candidatus Omnitrophota bacterium]